MNETGSSVNRKNINNAAKLNQRLERLPYLLEFKPHASKVSLSKTVNPRRPARSSEAPPPGFPHRDL